MKKLLTLLSIFFALPHQQPPTTSAQAEMMQPAKLARQQARGKPLYKATSTVTSSGNIIHVNAGTYVETLTSTLALGVVLRVKVTLPLSGHLSLYCLSNDNSSIKC